MTSRGPGGSAIRLRCERCGNEESPNPGGSSAEGAEVAFKANDVIGRRLGEDEDTTLPLCGKVPRPKPGLFVWDAAPLVELLQLLHGPNGEFIALEHGGHALEGTEGRTRGAPPLRW